MRAENGYKTRQRELILRLLTENRQRHLSVDEVVDYLREQHSPVGKSTVYRYLDRLVEQGCVRRYFLEEGRGACYQYSEGTEACKVHFHLKCTVCGQLLHLECNQLEQISEHVRMRHHFIVDHTKTVLYGLCQSCTHIAEGDCSCEKASSPF